LRTSIDAISSIDLIDLSLLFILYSIA